MFIITIIAIMKYLMYTIDTGIYHIYLLAHDKSSYFTKACILRPFPAIVFYDNWKSGDAISL